MNMQNSLIATKTCTVCKKVLPLEKFGKNKSRKDGLQCECKACRTLQAKQYNKKMKPKDISTDVVDTPQEALCKYAEDNSISIEQAKKHLVEDALIATGYLKKPLLLNTLCKVLFRGKSYVWTFLGFTKNGAPVCRDNDGVVRFPDKMPLAC